MAAMDEAMQNRAQAAFNEWWERVSVYGTDGRRVESFAEEAWFAAIEWASPRVIITSE